MPKGPRDELAHPDYWDKRYEAEANPEPENVNSEEKESYEWFKTFAQLKSFMLKELPDLASNGANSVILHLGNGTSTLPVDLHKLGYHGQIAVDFSSVAVANMQTRHADLEPPIDWKVMDVRNLELADGSVDIAIDKGTLDAMLYGSLWDLEDEVRENVGKYVDEVVRVLKPGAKWIYITYRQPHFVKPMLARDGVWDLVVNTLQEEGGMFEYFALVMTKKSSLSK